MPVFHADCSPLTYHDFFISPFALALSVLSLQAMTKVGTLSLRAAPATADIALPPSFATTTQKREGGSSPPQRLPSSSQPGPPWSLPMASPLRAPLGPSAPPPTPAPAPRLGCGFLLHSDLMSTPTFRASSLLPVH